MSIKPGDLFQWIYTYTNQLVDEGEVIYSYIMKKWVLCSGLCLCVSINDNIIYWVSDKGFFGAQTDEAYALRDPEAWRVVPTLLNHEYRTW